MTKSVEQLSEAEAKSTLGEQLVEAVLSIWNKVTQNEKVTDQNTTDIEILKTKVSALEKEVKGLKISKGMHKAKSQRLESDKAAAIKTLDEVRKILN